MLAHIVQYERCRPASAGAGCVEAHTHGPSLTEAYTLQLAAPAQETPETRDKVLRTMASLSGALALTFGTLLGLLFVLVAGLGKLVPGHPMYQVLSATFEKAIGPFFGVSAPMARLLRLVIGAAELSAGTIFLLVLWGEVAGLPAEVKPTAEALLLCAVMGMLNIMIGALTFNWVVEQQTKKVIPYFVFLFLLSGLFAQRLEVTDFVGMPKNWRNFIYSFPCICAVGLIGSLACAAKFGAKITDIRKQMEDIEKLREQLLSK